MTTTTLLITTLSSLATVSPETAEAPAPTPPAPAVQEEDSGWAGNLNFGLVRTRGNTDTLDVDVTGRAEKTVGEKNRYSAYLFYNYGETNGGIVERKAGIGAQYDYLAGERVYYYASVGTETDTLANLRRRDKYAAGVGYQIYDTEDFDYAGELGVGYIEERYNGATPDRSNITAKLGYDLDWILSERTKFMQDFEAWPAIEGTPVNGTYDVFLRLDSRIQTMLTETMNGMIQYVLDWDSTPSGGAKRADHRVVLSLGWTFGG